MEIWRAAGVPIGGDHDPAPNDILQVLTGTYAEFVGGRTSVLIHRRQVESMDLRDSTLFSWISDPRSHFQARHAEPGTLPSGRFIYMLFMDSEAITAVHGPPERIVPCGGTPIWVFPPDWQPINWLIALADPLVPEALAIGREVCIAPERVNAEGLVLNVPAGAFRLAPMGAARLRLSDERSGQLLGEVAPQRPYQSVRSRSTDFGQVGFEPEQVPTARKPAFYLGF